MLNSIQHPGYEGMDPETSSGWRVDGRSTHRFWTVARRLVRDEGPPLWTGAIIDDSVPRLMPRVSDARLGARASDRSSPSLPWWPSERHSSTAGTASRPGSASARRRYGFRYRICNA